MVAFLRRSCLRPAMHLGAALVLAACGGGGGATGPEPGGGAGGVAEAGADGNDAGTGGSPGDVAVDPPVADASDAADAKDAAAEPDAAPGLCAPDEDKDEIPDEVEGKATNVDTDGDGTPDWKDGDSDNDSIPDLVEGNTKKLGCFSPQNSDGTPPPDWRDTDSDDNGLPDKDEVYPDGKPYDPSKPKPNPADTDGDGTPDYADLDNDDDALPDKDELVGGKAVDTDGDGLPDLDDPDSDNDSIADGMEGTGDFDKDGKPNFRDDDSDGDGLSDLCEAGPGHQLKDLPADSDLDGKYDFLDVDSDNDGLLDSEEDKNKNCKLDPGETDPHFADSDGDGVGDLVEVVLGSDPLDPLDEPRQHGKFYFVIPYNQPPKPAKDVLAVRTDLQKIDVGFVVDTTGTMGPEIQQLKSGLSTIIAALKNQIPDVAVGVAAHDDFPAVPYGDPAQDNPYYLPSPKAIVTTSQQDAITAVGALTLHGGGDLPESQIAAMFRALTNKPMQWPGKILDPDAVPKGRFGSLQFRDDALTVLVGITDAAFHNGRRASQPASLHDAYGFNDTPPYPTPKFDDLVAEMTPRGARYIGIACDDGVRSGDPYQDMAYLCDKAQSDVPPAAFGGTCNTALGGTPLASPDGPNGTCRLVFDVYKNGQGLTQRVVDGVKALLKSLRLDVRVVAIPDANAMQNPPFVDTVDDLIDHVEVSTTGGKDPTDPLQDCVTLPGGGMGTVDKWKGAKGIVGGPDGYWETVTQVIPTTKICYEVVPFKNLLFPATDKAQVFKATLQVRAKNGINPIELDFGPPREIVFIVPPAPQ